MSPRTALTLGNFDGVHRGHRSLVEHVTAWRRAQPDPHSIRTLVVTFDPHPVEVLRPGTRVPRLCSLSQRVHFLQNLGVDEVRVVPFTAEFAATSARDFFDRFLVGELKPVFLAVGHDFHFGRGREGTPGKLLDWCEDSGVTAKLVDPVEADGGPVSSTRIRGLIGQGQMIAAARLLGRDYSLCGEVVHGNKRGRQIGFPTANLLPPTDGHAALCLPANGVYLSSATVEGRTFAAVTNVGVKPTVTSANQILIETHLLDFDGDLYGKLMTVEFRDRLRAEMKFSGIQQLTEQIRIDTQLARARTVLK